MLRNFFKKIRNLTSCFVILIFSVFNTEAMFSKSYILDEINYEKLAITKLKNEHHILVDDIEIRPFYYESLKQELENQVKLFKNEIDKFFDLGLFIREKPRDIVWVLNYFCMLEHRSARSSRYIEVMRKSKDAEEYTPLSAAASRASEIYFPLFDNLNEEEYKKIVKHLKEVFDAYHQRLSEKDFSPSIYAKVFNDIEPANVYWKAMENIREQLYAPKLLDQKIKKHNDQIEQCKNELKIYAMKDLLKGSKELDKKNYVYESFYKYIESVIPKENYKAIHIRYITLESIIDVLDLSAKDKYELLDLRDSSKSLKQYIIEFICHCSFDDIDLEVLLHETLVRKCKESKIWRNLLLALIGIQKSSIDVDSPFIFPFKESQETLKAFNFIDPKKASLSGITFHFTRQNVNIPNNLNNLSTYCIKADIFLSNKKVSYYSCFKKGKISKTSTCLYKYPCSSDDIVFHALEHILSNFFMNTAEFIGLNSSVISNLLPLMYRIKFNEARFCSNLKKIQNLYPKYQRKKFISKLFPILPQDIKGILNLTYHNFDANFTEIQKMLIDYFSSNRFYSESLINNLEIANIFGMFAVDYDNECVVFINNFCDVVKFAEEKRPIPFVLSLVNYPKNIFYEADTNFMNFLSVVENPKFLDTYLALFHINYRKYLNSMSILARINYFISCLYNSLFTRRIS